MSWMQYQIVQVEKSSQVVAKIRTSRCSGTAGSAHKPRGSISAGGLDHQGPSQRQPVGCNLPCNGCSFYSSVAYNGAGSESQTNGFPTNSEWIMAWFPCGIEACRYPVPRSIHLDASPTMQERRSQARRRVAHIACNRLRGRLTWKIILHRCS